MKLKLLFWNVREVNDSNKRKVIKALTRLKEYIWFVCRRLRSRRCPLGWCEVLELGRFMEWGVVNVRIANFSLRICGRPYSFVLRICG